MADLPFDPISLGGNIASTGLGVWQMIQAGQDKKQANAFMNSARGNLMGEGDIPNVAGSMISARNRYRRKSAALNTGIEYKNELDNMRTVGAGGFKTILNRGGNEALMTRLLGSTMNNALAKGAENQKFFDTLFMKAQEDIDANKWREFSALDKVKADARGLDLAQYSQLMAKSIAGTAAGADNVLGGVMGGAGDINDWIKG